MIALTAESHLRFYSGLPTVASLSQRWSYFAPHSSTGRSLSFTEAGIDAVQVEYVPSWNTARTKARTQPRVVNPSVKSIM